MEKCHVTKFNSLTLLESGFYISMSIISFMEKSDLKNTSYQKIIIKYNKRRRSHPGPQRYPLTWYDHNDTPSLPACLPWIMLPQNHKIISHKEFLTPSEKLRIMQCHPIREVKWPSAVQIRYTKHYVNKASVDRWRPLRVNAAF